MLELICFISLIGFRSIKYLQKFFLLFSPLRLKGQNQSRSHGLALAGHTGPPNAAESSGLAALQDPCPTPVCVDCKVPLLQHNASCLPGYYCAGCFAQNHAQNEARVKVLRSACMGCGCNITADNKSVTPGCCFQCQAAQEKELENLAALAQGCLEQKDISTHLHPCLRLILLRMLKKILALRKVLRALTWIQIQQLLKEKIWQRSDSAWWTVLLVSHPVTVGAPFTRKLLLQLVASLTSR